MGNINRKGNRSTSQQVQHLKQIKTVDLFENLNFVPVTVAKEVNKLGEQPTYNDLQEVKSNLNSMGYTLDYGLDAVPLNLRRI